MNFFLLITDSIGKGKRTFNMQDEDSKSLQRLGKALKAIRLKRKWKLSKLSNYAGIRPSTLMRIESDESEPKYLTLEKIAYAFNLSLAELFQEISTHLQNNDFILK